MNPATRSSVSHSDIRQGEPAFACLTHVSLPDYRHSVLPAINDLGAAAGQVVALVGTQIPTTPGVSDPDAEAIEPPGVQALRV